MGESLSTVWLNGDVRMSPFEQAWLLLKEQKKLSDFMDVPLPVNNVRRKRIAPSHIELNDQKNIATLIGQDGQHLSQVTFPESLRRDELNQIGEAITPHAQRRQGHYRALLENLIHHGYGIKSNARNSNSGPFHQNLSQNIRDVTVQRPDREELLPADVVTYMPNRTELKWGDLRGPHRIALPIQQQSQSTNQMNYLSPLFPLQQSENGPDYQQTIFSNDGQIKIPDDDDRIEYLRRLGRA